MPEAEATLIGVGTSDPAARLTYLAAGADLIGESSVLDAGGRLTDPVFIVPEDARQTPDLAAAADLPALEGDWTQFEQLDDLTQTHFGAKLVDGVWEVGEEYQQGSRMAGAFESWRWEDSGIDYPARYWNGIDDTVANQKFHVDDVGNVRVAGTLEAGSLDIPAAGVSGFHVDATGNLGAGGTSATDADSEFLASAAGVVSARSATIYPKDSTAVALTVKDDKGTSGNLVEMKDGSDAVLWQMALDGRVDQQGRLAMPNTTDNGLFLGGDVTLKRTAANVLTIGLSGFGDTVELIEQTAPTTPAANALRVYAKDNAGVSALYYKGDDGVEVGPLGAGGGAPTTADYLVGTAQAGLSAEIVVGTTPGGQLAGASSTWASPTIVAFTGDVTKASGGTALTIANDAVTYAKMQDVSATDRLLGRDTAAAGDVEELQLGAGLVFTGTPGIDLASHGPTYHANRTMRVHGVAMTPDGSTATVLGAGTTALRTFSCADGATQGEVGHFWMPEDTVAGTGLTVTIDWFPSATDATSKAVRWQIVAAVIGTGTVATIAGTTTTFTGSVANKTVDVRFTEAVQTALASVAPGDLIRLTIHRLGADGADTYTGAARLLANAVNVTYTSDQ